VAVVTVHAIINPRSAGGGTAKRLAHIENRLAASFPGLRLHHTTGPRHATALARSLAREGASHLLVVGGDGTWHEVVEGCLEPGPGPGPILSLIPQGTGSDMRRSLGVPGGLDAAIARARAGVPRRVDAARLSWRSTNGDGQRAVVANIASIGMSADVAVRTHAGTVTKARLGPLAFLLEGIGAATRHQRHRLRLTLDEEPPVEVTVLLCAVCNGHTFGGGMRVAPQARIDDGWLEVVWIDALPRPGVLAFLPSVYPGLHQHLPWVHQRRARRVIIEPLTAAPVEVDGEVPGAVGALTFEVLPQALRVT
jgi:YegS/Rv2252/BmrU family lipid kinase